MGLGEQPADRRRVGDLAAKIMATASSRSTQATSSSAPSSMRSKRSSDGTGDSDRARNSRIVSLLKPGLRRIRRKLHVCAAGSPPSQAQGGDSRATP
jgi:hypothetical protein